MQIKARLSFVNRQYWIWKKNFGHQYHDETDESVNFLATGTCLTEKMNLSNLKTLFQL